MRAHRRAPWVSEPKVEPGLGGRGGGRLEGAYVGALHPHRWAAMSPLCQPLSFTVTQDLTRPEGAFQTPEPCHGKRAPAFSWHSGPRADAAAPLQRGAKPRAERTQQPCRLGPREAGCYCGLPELRCLQPVPATRQGATWLGIGTGRRALWLPRPGQRPADAHRFTHGPVHTARGDGIGTGRAHLPGNGVQSAPSQQG